MKKYLSFLVLAVTVCALVLSFTACSLSLAKSKDFSKAGLTITLTDDFSEQDIVTQTAYYVSQKAIVTTLKEESETIADLTVKEYAELVCTINKLDESSVVVKDGYAEFTYEKEVNGKEYYYYARCFKNGTAFWLIQFGCETKNSEEYQKTFEKWAATVTFED